ncbi:MAG: anaerobic ribonucleoside triphosphate reductase [Desulfurococcaceae archaeon]
MVIEIGREVSPEELLKKYYGSDDLLSKENANRYKGPTGFFSYLLDNYLSRFVDIIPSPVIKAHVEGYIYIHKLPYSLYIPYCTGHSISRLLEYGLRTPTVNSNPAKHFDTFVDHVANYLILMQHFFSGAQAFSSVELYAGPYIRNDKLGYRDIKQNIQRLLFNLNYPSRVGFQSSFTNFTVTLDAAYKVLQEDRAVFNGVKLGPLGEYLDEAKLFVKAFAELLGEGDAYSMPFTFPIPTLMATAKSIWEDPEVFESIFITSASKGSFYWLNTRIVDPNASYAMCCRINIDRNLLVRFNNSGNFRFSIKDLEDEKEIFLKTISRKKFGGVWCIPDVTGSINVTDINLPRLAYESNGEDHVFWEKLDKALAIAKAAEDWFRHRYIDLISNYSEMYMLVRKYLPEFPSQYFNTIGLIGLPEAAAILMREPKLWVEGSRRDMNYAAGLMSRIVEYVVDKTMVWMEETGVPWNVEEVPGESASAKLAINDVKIYPEILEYLPDPENPIYSTSIVPYYSPLELTDRVEIEEKVQKKFTGGVMLHIFLNEKPDYEALAKLTRRLIDTELVYWSYTPALTYCNNCRTTFTGLHYECPKCGNTNLELWSRIVGYYRPLSNWNPYKRKEFFKRYHYRLSLIS